MLETLLQDIRFGFRSLAKRPGFAFVAIFVLALGIGANTAIFSVFNAILLRPLPYSEPDRLVMIFGTRPLDGAFRGWTSPLNFLDLRADSHSFSGIAPMHEAKGTLLGSGEPFTLSGWAVGQELFQVLRAQPFMGRAFSPEEDRPGGPSVLILSHDAWQKRFGSDPHIVGKAVTLDGAPVSVIGVMPAGFDFPAKSDFWKPLQLKATEHDRGSHFLSLIARLRPGVTVQRAQAELDGIAQRLGQQFPQSNRNRGWQAVRLRDYIVGDLRPALIALLGAVALLLLIACGNIGNLLLARAVARSNEIALRSALGAGRGRMVRQLVTEGLGLALVAGVVGLLLGIWGSRLLVAIAPEGIPRLNEVGLDFRVLLFTFGITCLTVLVFGVVPAFQAVRLNLSHSLKEGSRGAGNSRERGLARSLFVVAELTLTLTLLVGAGLLLRSFKLLVGVTPGFDASRVLTSDLLLPEWKYGGELQRVLDFYSRLEAQLSGQPGVESAAVVFDRPVRSINHWQAQITIDGRKTDEELKASMNLVSASYFRTMRIPLLRGEIFSDTADMKTPGVVILSASAARRMFPGEDPLGKVITHDIDLGPQVARSRRVIGVVGDVKQSGLSADDEPQIYVPHRQVPAPQMSLLVRTSADPLRLADQIRKTVWSIDKDVPVENVTTMTDILSESVGKPEFYTILLSAFAVVGLILAAVGLYGVLAYGVSQRTHEFGIRMALGARPREIVTLVVRHGLLLALAGLVLGLGSSVALSRILASILFKIKPTDLLTYCVAVLVLLAATLLACMIPARRATRVDPGIALRYD